MPFEEVLCQNASKKGSLQTRRTPKICVIWFYSLQITFELNGRCCKSLYPTIDKYQIKEGRSYSQIDTCTTFESLYRLHVHMYLFDLL